jgi:hypothetical protein
MVTIEERPMTMEERQIVGRWEKPVLAPSVDWGCVGLPLFCALIGALLGVLLAAGVSYLLAGAAMAHWWQSTCPLGLLIGAAAGVAYALMYGHRKLWFRRGYTDELATGRVLQWQCTASAAVRVNSPDEGTLPGYLLQVEEHSVLFLDSFHLSELEGEASFPCHRFSVVLLPDVEHVVRVLCQEGPSLTVQNYQINPQLEALPQHPLLMPGDINNAGAMLLLRD